MLLRGVLRSSEGYAGGQWGCWGYIGVEEYFEGFGVLSRLHTQKIKCIFNVRSPVTKFQFTVKPDTSSSMISLRSSKIFPVVQATSWMVPSDPV